MSAGDALIRRGSAHIAVGNILSAATKNIARDKAAVQQVIHHAATISSGGRHHDYSTPTPRSPPRTPQRAKKDTGDNRLYFCIGFVITVALWFATAPQQRRRVRHAEAHPSATGDGINAITQPHASDLALSLPALAGFEPDAEAIAPSTSFLGLRGGGSDDAMLRGGNTVEQAAIAPAASVPAALAPPPQAHAQTQAIAQTAPQPPPVQPAARPATAAFADGAPAWLFEPSTQQEGLSADLLAQRQAEVVAFMRARGAQPEHAAASRATARFLHMKAWREKGAMGQFLNDIGVAGPRGLEIGVAVGRNCRNLRKRWNGGHVTCMDPWDQKNDSDRGKKKWEFTETIRRMRKFPANTFTLLKAFANVEKARRDEWPLGSLEFVYLDARKGYLKVKEDLLDWAPRVRPGGILSGHDYCVDPPVGPGCSGTHDGSPFTVGVRQAVDELAAELKRKVYYTTEPGKEDKVAPSWYFVI